MQENRSFDHYFGTLAGVRGFGDAHAIKQANGRSIFYQPDPQNPDGYLLPWHLDTKRTSSQAIPSTSHAWAVQHSAWNGGKMDNWLPAHIAADGPHNGPYTMGYYKREDIPFHFALAESFTLCDQYHCSLLGPTWPNRLYLMSASIDPGGTRGGPVISNVVPSPFRWTTYPERLQRAGISWNVYQEEDDYGCNVLEFFKAYQDAKAGSPLYDGGLKISPPDQFERDARRGSLPTVSWIIPTSGQSEHPAYIPASGADFLASKLEAVASNPDLWSKTVFIINYDENDGLFDHVPPPVPPAGTPNEFVDGLPIGGGIRVPCIIVSPWTVGGWVASEPFDHTSVLRLLERVTGVRETNITPWRRRTFGDLTSALGFSRGRKFPSLPATKHEFWRAEHEVRNLPPAKIPGAHQTPPVQEKHRPHKPSTQKATAIAAESGAEVGFPATISRLVETRTTHRDDFPHGTGDTIFPGKLAAVAGAAAATGDTRLAYIPGVAGAAIAVVNTATFKLLSAIEGPTNPYGIAATPDGSKLYVTDAGTNLVYVIDPSTTKVTGSIVVGVYPHGIAASPNGRHMYVANTGPDTGPGGSASLSIIDTRTDKVARRIKVGPAPQIIAVSPKGSRLYVTCDDGLHVIGLSRGSNRTVHKGLASAHGVTISRNDKIAYVANSERGEVVVLSTAANTVRRRIAVGQMPWNVALTDDGKRAYVTNANDDTISVIATATHQVVAKVTVGHIPTGITAHDGTMWVANNTSSTISVIDTATNKVKATVDLGLGDEPTEIAIV